MADKVSLSEFVAGFLIEAEEHLHSVNRNLVATSEALRKGQPEPRAIRELFRSLHTIKGLAAMVGAEPVVDVAHEMESLLRTADRAGGRLDEPTLDLIAQGTRAVEERVRAIAQNGMDKIPPAPRKLIEAMALAQGQSPTVRPATDYTLTLPPELESALAPADREQIIQASLNGQRVVLLDFQPSPERAGRGQNITSVRTQLNAIGALVKVVPRSSKDAPTGIAFSLLLVTTVDDAKLEEITGAPAVTVHASATESATSPEGDGFAVEAEVQGEWLPSDQSSIRVDVRRLDEALEQLSGLFVTRFKLERAMADLAAGGADVRDLRAVINENSRQLRRLRSAISEARMVPLAELLQRLPLVVRGITKDSQKSVNVTLLAGSTEVDKAVADKIFPAVVHLVRNAVDHALETRGERKAAGKPEIGELSIVCDDSSGTSLVLSIRDDGRGIDRDAVAHKAGRPPARDDEELLQQICLAGLSTSAAITHTSGRGMGMDIVKRTVELLGGSLALATVPGQGTTITLRVPVNVTIVDVLSFISGHQTFVVPVAIVDEIVEIDPSLYVDFPVPERGGPRTRLIQHRGKSIPLFVLDALLQGAPDGVAPLKALIVNQGRGPVAFGIERMIGKQEAVVRPLDDALLRVTGMAGATDLGDGRPTLVLDLSALSASVMQSGRVSQ